MPPCGGGVNGQHLSVGRKNTACRVSKGASLLTSLWIRFRGVGYGHRLTQFQRFCYECSSVARKAIDILK